ncbi:Phosducin-like protein [Holothuria leucospilota]|uniref:Phosducin-like protein n=1 Tax=Holothuria leucospilota TaxID=206669 RepID=A0A9Q1CL26_HOLLE|nr:Phosducin-like protein [Holothuria leucospilota]
MATMDDKILGEKLQYYYSSSDDERDDDDDDDVKCSGEDADCGEGETSCQPDEDFTSGSATHTGPKGVLEDWRRYKQLETERRKEQEDERMALARKLALTCRTYDDDLKDKQEDEELAELGLDLEDEFLKQYREQRMKEMTDQLVKNRPVFGSVLELTRENYVDAIDNENKSVSVVVHVYGNSSPGCEALDGCFQCLCKEYPTVKFCRAAATAMQVSHSFCQNGLPALLVYRGGQLVGNFVKVTDYLGEDFFSVEVEAFLQDHGLLPNKDETAIVRGGGAVTSTAAESGDSDLDLD